MALTNNTKWAESMAESIAQAAAHAGAGESFCFGDLRWELFSSMRWICAVHHQLRNSDIWGVKHLFGT